MAAPSLQYGIDEAGSTVRLLWKPNAAPWTPEVVEREYAGWREEQEAWHEDVAISDLSHHMFDTFLSGPDATRLLAAVSARVADINTNIKNMEAHTDDDRGARIDMTVEISDLKHLEKVIKSLRAVNGVLDVERAAR